MLIVNQEEWKLNSSEKCVCYNKWVCKDPRKAQIKVMAVKADNWRESCELWRVVQCWAVS